MTIPSLGLTGQKTSRWRHKQVISKPLEQSSGFLLEIIEAQNFQRRPMVLAFAPSPMLPRVFHPPERCWTRQNASMFGLSAVDMLSSGAM